MLPHGETNSPTESLQAFRLGCRAKTPVIGYLLNNLQYVLFLIEINEMHSSDRGKQGFLPSLLQFSTGLGF